MVTVVQVLAAVGVLYLIPTAYRFFSFIWLYVLRPSSVHNYIHGPPAYALVTGATDGIGKAVATELYAQGYNLVLHGRNEQKMHKVIDGIRAGGATRDIRYFLADAAMPGHDFAGMVEPFKDLNITIVLHNVGGSVVQRKRLDELDESAVMSSIHWNAIFPLLLTRALLPSLRASARHGPVLVQFVGSLAAVVSPPRLALYAGSKAFLQALARSLDLDERVWDAPTGVRFAYLAVGEVVSNSMQVDVSLGSPSAASFGKALVARMGCGWGQYAPWMPHAVMQVVTEAMGRAVIENAVAKRIGELLSMQEAFDKRVA
ncbi:NAD-P-binding protein [Amylocystis lapponica]|nr:NAD-P-binding protein [Amylocystis lapponica]